MNRTASSCAAHDWAWSLGERRTAPPPSVRDRQVAAQFLRAASRMTGLESEVLRRRAAELILPRHLEPRPESTRRASGLG
jgi:hypothetical protein